MKITHALSIKQPWASMICEGVKDIENRTWKPPAFLIGQRFAIHASKQCDQRFETLDDIQAKFGRLPSQLEYGAIIGSAILKGFARPDQAHSSPWRDEGSFGWILESAEYFPEPIPFKGQLGVWWIGEELTP